MKTIRKIMALALVLCMAAAMGVWNTDAHADWYTVQFNKLDNRTFENIPTGVTLTTTAAAPASSADTSASTTAGAAADPQKPGQLEWFYNPWAGTLVIRGRGAMVGFDEKHPAPWHNESKRALRVIIDEGVTTISNEAFKDFIYLRSVVFPSTLKGISATAFEKCEKLKRVEVVTEIKDAEKLIEASKSKELLMDDVKIIRVTKEAVRREICWLTTYWWCRVEIYRDKAGRPIRIIEHKIDGSVIDTGIKYLNEATAVNEAKNPNTAERIYSVRTYPSGAKTAVETEKNEYGANLIKGDYDLNKDGRQVSGTETTLWGNKRTLEDAKYKDNGSGTKYWTEVYASGYTAVMLEKVDKNDKVLSVETVTYDRNGVVNSRAVTENTYNKDGNKTSTSSVAVDNEGNTLSEATTSYTYSGKKLTGMTTETQEAGGSSKKTEKSFTYDRDGNLATATTETVSQSGSETSTTTTVTSYTYTDTGLKKSATEATTHSDGSVDVTEKKYDKYERPEKEKSVHTDKNGKVTATSETENSYNSEHVRSESIETTTYADGSKSVIVHTYDSDGRFVTAASVLTDAEGKTISSSTQSRTYNADGKKTSDKYESTNKEGKTKTEEEKYSYDAQGRILVKQVSKTGYDGKTTVENTNRSYDSKGRIVKETYEEVNPDGTKSGSITTYTYHEDGTYEETKTPIGEKGETVQQVKKEYNSSGAVVSTATEDKVLEESNALTMTAASGSENSTVPAAQDTDNGGNTGPQTSIVFAKSRSVPPCDHIFEYNRTEPATCTEPANMVYVCSVCNNVERREPVGKPLDHNYELTSTEASCKEGGEETWTCSVCGDKITKKGEALGHDYQLTSTTASCTTGGEETWTCTRCDDSYTVQVKASHNYTSAVTVEPTCEAEGEITYTCSDCGGSYSETVKAFGHSYVSELTKLPTCKEEGEMTYTCTRCSNSYTEPIKTLEHSYLPKMTKETTCVDDGEWTYTCYKCGDSYTKAVEAYGHCYETETTDPTCTEPGSKVTKCLNCGDISKTETIEAKGHSYDEELTKKPTCTEAGEKTLTCSVCSDVKTEAIDALGHDYKEVTIDPTCTEPGSKVMKCTRCDDICSSEEIPALGHDEVEVPAEAATCSAAGHEAGTKCSRCGKVLSGCAEIPVLAHQWDGGTVTTSPTCSSEGIRTYTCTSCGTTKTEPIGKTEHQYVTMTNTTATCEAGGVETWACACGATIGKDVGAYGHSWGDPYTKEEGGISYHTCGRCGAEEVA